MCDAEGDNLLELGTATLSKAEEGFIDCHSVTRNYVFQGSIRHPFIVAYRPFFLLHDVFR